MALNIKDEQADRLARELVRETGESITEATRIALQERLTRVRQRRHVSGGASDVQGIIDRGRARQVLDRRPADQVLGYDADGLPG